MSLSNAELARYSRHLLLNEFGEAGQQKLKAAKVLVVGTGGLGSPALLYLAAAGVGTIGIVDFDKVDMSNLQRQVLFSTEDVGQPKAVIAARRLNAMNPLITTHAHDIELNAVNVMDVVSQYEVVIDGCDRFVTRYLVNDACVLLGKPLVSAAIHRFEGQAFVYVPDEGPCYRCLFPEQPSGDLVPNCATAGVLGVLPGLMGTIQATEAIKLITGIGSTLTGRLLTYDALDMRFIEFEFARRHDCAVCGDTPSISAPQEQIIACATDEEGLSIAELQTLLHESSENVQIIDVREPHEYALGHLPHSINIPLANLSEHLYALDRNKRMIFICRSGARSGQALQLATQRGVLNSVNLTGGLQRWNSAVDAEHRCVL
ncbi:MAG TPA: molybdopterin-synthase adenylyltransferase MoeB [Steroidobacteraceae bacterium]|nr:molybdopterin-synthase adenylyltransferase MoeB [Steroidobacteraceae bacterium]